jgi:hypothetical protein
VVLQLAGGVESTRLAFTHDGCDYMLDWSAVDRLNQVCGGTNRFIAIWVRRSFRRRRGVWRREIQVQNLKSSSWDCGGLSEKPFRD